MLRMRSPDPATRRRAARAALAVRTPSRLIAGLVFGVTWAFAWGAAPVAWVIGDYRVGVAEPAEFIELLLGVLTLTAVLTPLQIGAVALAGCGACAAANIVRGERRPERCALALFPAILLYAMLFAAPLHATLAIAALLTVERNLPGTGAIMIACLAGAPAAAGLVLATVFTARLHRRLLRRAP